MRGLAAVARGARSVSLTPAAVAKRELRTRVDRLRSFMDRNGLFEEQVSAKLGIGSTRFWAILNGATPSTGEAERIEALLADDERSI